MWDDFCGESVFSGENAHRQVKGVTREYSDWRILFCPTFQMARGRFNGAVFLCVRTDTLDESDSAMGQFLIGGRVWNPGIHAVWLVRNRHTRE